MKQLRATVRVDPGDGPELVGLLAHSSEISEARLLDVNTTIGGFETMLFAIDGDPSTFAERARETEGVDSVTLSVRAGERSYALVVADPLETPLCRSIHEFGPAAGFVLQTPIRYRDGAMFCRVVGDPEPLQEAVDVAPDWADVDIAEIGQFRGGLEDPIVRLSDRQRAALEAAHELGYYDQPRGVTHEDIAAALECAPATASDHLQKAEAKLVSATLSDHGPST